MPLTLVMLYSFFFHSGNLSNKEYSSVTGLSNNTSISLSATLSFAFFILLQEIKSMLITIYNKVYNRCIFILFIINRLNNIRKRDVLCKWSLHYNHWVAQERNGSTFLLRKLIISSVCIFLYLYWQK